MRLNYIEPVMIFYAYAQKDDKLRERLDTHLNILKRKGLITTWDKHNVSAGSEPEQEMINFLEKSEIILLLISADFIASDFCWSHHMTRTLQRHIAKKNRVLPILFKPAMWSEAPFGKLQPLPQSGKPITSWKDRETAFVEVAQAIKQVIVELQTSPVPSKSINSRGAIVNSTEYYQEALQLFKDESEKNPSNGYCWYYIGDIYKILKRFQEALEAYEKALQLGVKTMGVYAGRAKVLYSLREYEKALSAYAHLIYSIAPKDPYCFYSYSIVAYELKHFKEAFGAFQLATSLSRNINATYEHINSFYQDDANALDVPDGYREFVMKS